MHEFSKQPLKGAYLVYQALSTLFVRFPLWTLLNLPPSWRPRKTWDLRRAVMVNVVRHFMSISNKTGPWLPTPDHRAITGGKGVNGVWVPPAPELINAELQSYADVVNAQPVRIPGYWRHKKGTNIPIAAGPQPNVKVLYNLHGGAYIRMSAHPNDSTNNIVSGILKFVPSITRAFSLEYRLSSTVPFEVANAFPTALIDAIAGYNYLVNIVGIAPESIVLCGDSAGANLAHALTRYLVSNASSPSPVPNLPTPPGALILLCPWADMSNYHENLASGSAFAMAVSDYIGARDGGHSWSKDAFTGAHGRGITETNPYLSPASLHPGFTISFKGFPRTFLNGGGAEVLIDQIRTLKERMVKDLGEGNGVQEGEGRVRYHEAPDAIHDYLVLGWHEPERSDTLRAIADWVDAQA